MKKTALLLIAAAALFASCNKELNTSQFNLTLEQTADSSYITTNNLGRCNSFQYEVEILNNNTNDFESYTAPNGAEIYISLPRTDVYYVYIKQNIYCNKNNPSVESVFTD